MNLYNPGIIFNFFHLFKIAWTALYSAENFNSYGIELRFLRTEYIEYKQFKNDFSPYLSIIDVMMFNSKEEIMNILDMYSLT